MQSIFTVISCSLMFFLCGCFQADKPAEKTQEVQNATVRSIEINPEDYRMNEALCFLVTRSGLWIGTPNGIDVYSFPAFQKDAAYPKFLPEHRILKLLSGSDGSVYAISDKKGLYHLPPETLEFYHTGSSVIRDAVVAKGTGAIYCATSHGVDVLQNQTWTNIRVSQPMAEFESKANDLTAIAQDATGAFWLGSEFGVFRMSGGNFQFFYGDFQIIQGTAIINRKGNVPLGGNLFYSICTIGENGLAFATNGGVSVLNDLKNPSNPSAWILYNGNHTLSKMENGKIVEFQVRGNSPLPSNFVRSVYAFEDQLAIGTEEGMAIRSFGKWKVFDLQSELSGNRVYSFLKLSVSDGDFLLAGTNAGMSIFSVSILGKQE